jgi:adenosylhomocysteine nucleosidase
VSRILVVTAIEREARSLARDLGLVRAAWARWPCFEGTRVIVMAAGIRAKFLDARWPPARPALVVSAGLCGGLTPALNTVGALALPRAILGAGGAALAVDAAAHGRAVGAALAAGLAFSTEPLLTVDDVVDGPDAKAQLARETGAAAVDMESAAVVRAAAGRGAPGLVVRAVSDPVQRALPRELAGLVAGDGRARPAAVGALLVRRPGLIGDALALRRDSARALRSVAAVIRHLATTA